MTIMRLTYDGHRLARLLTLLSARAMGRIREARFTGALEFGIVLYGFASVYQSIVQGGGFTLGWAILGKGISQPEYGYVLAVQNTLRLLAVLFLAREWRFRLAWTDLAIQGTILYAVRAANPTSAMLAPLFVFGVLGNLWAIGADAWSRYERPQ